MNDATCLPTTTWFLYSEDDVPLGRIYKSGEPKIATPIEDGPGFASGEVVSFSELRATCAMRRFKVTVRVLT